MKAGLYANINAKQARITGAETPLQILSTDKDPYYSKTCTAGLGAQPGERP
jgi:hypothetical protein